MFTQKSDGMCFHFEIFNILRDMAVDEITFLKVNKIFSLLCISLCLTGAPVFKNLEDKKFIINSTEETFETFPRMKVLFPLSLSFLFDIHHHLIIWNLVMNHSTPFLPTKDFQ